MNNKPFKCLHCGRNLGACCPHICRGTMRKRNRIFKHRVTGVIYGTKEAIIKYNQKLTAQ